MSKKLFYGLMALLTSFSLVSCGDEENEDTSSESKILKELNDNQAYLDGKIFDFDYTLDVRPAQVDGDYVDEGAHYLSINGEGFSGRLDLGTPLVGSTINLANPCPDVKEHQFSIGTEEFSLDVYDNTVFSHIQEVNYENESCFSSGSVVIGESAKEFTFTLAGTLKNGKVLAIKVVVPAAEINVWD